VSAIRVRPCSSVPPDVDLDLDHEFFDAGWSTELELTHVDEEPENPALSPAQYQRRRRLRLQVTMLMAVLVLFSSMTVFAQLFR
jgi:hypothetical protein